MDSPLTQQTRPEVFEPKVVGLYRLLFRESEDDDKTEGFWRTLFLLKPDVPALKEILESTDSEYLLLLQHQPQQLLLQAIAHVKAGESPSDENALDTLTAFFAVVLSKRFTNPSSDIIEVLAGLDNVDAVFSDLVTILDHIIKDGRTVQLRQKAVKTSIAVVSGGYQTALVSYFIHRDFFPGLMKLLHQLDSPLQASEPFLLTGLLANYNKFEVHNQYRVRFADFVNEDTMKQVVESVSWTSILLRERYITIQDDTPTGWSLSGTLSYVGLGSLTGAKPAAPVLTEEQQKELFREQPGSEASMLLTLYDFTLVNKLFCHCFVTLPSAEKTLATPFSNFISFTSYLYQHANRTVRASLYAYLTLLIFLNFLEDDTLAKALSENRATVRFCRQRLPHLPLSKADRPYTVSIIDLLTDGLNHNLRKRLDISFYSQSIRVLSRVLTYLAKSRTKLSHHWAELWRCLLSFVRFLTAYEEDLKTLTGINEMAESVVDLLTLALTNGEAFLPDSAAYDDLVYKLAESGDALVKFRDTYDLTKLGQKSSINSLINVAKHYQELIQTQKTKSTHLSHREVGDIIKKGYGTLAIEANEGVYHSEAFREGDHKTELKKVTRAAVADATLLVS